MSSHWSLRAADPSIVRLVERSVAVHPLVARLLAARGHGEPEAARAHLEASLHALHDPNGLPDMGKACDRLARAVRDGETILVHGDYDVDGVAGTVLLVRVLRHLGARVRWTIPDRSRDGYSFGPHSVERARGHEASVVISVDNGTSAAETIGELRELGIDTIVTDHHEPPRGALPPAVAIVNPKLPDSAYPFRELCGSGVAFKVAWGLCQRISGTERVRDDLRSLLLECMAYVALATVCDVVPLVDENRVLARKGLIALGQAPTAGLRALLDVSGLKTGGLRAEDVGFKIGPRINAAGRLATADLAVDLLLEEDPVRARARAEELDRLNTERRRVEAELVAQALEAAAPYADAEAHPFLVLAGEGWHQGVVGIVAARLVDRFGRPALVIGLDGEKGRGSARSVPGFDCLEAMHGGAEHMERYGGHAMAAGCEVRADAVEPLRRAIEAKAGEMLRGGAGGAPPMWIDDELPLPHMTPQLMGQLDRLEPYGERNEAPVLLSTDVRLAEPPRAVGADGSHLLLRVRHGETVLKAMAFGMAPRVGELEMGAPLHLVYTPRWNVFRGETRLELVLHDFRVGPRPSMGRGEARISGLGPTGGVTPGDQGEEEGA